MSSRPPVPTLKGPLKGGVQRHVEDSVMTDETDGGGMSAQIAKRLTVAERFKVLMRPDPIKALGPRTVEIPMKAMGVRSMPSKMSSR